jgi:hypothetical protein
MFCTMATFTAKQRADYVPPPCPECGSLDIEVEWIPTPDYSGVTSYIPGRMWCRICRNEQRPAE